MTFAFVDRSFLQIILFTEVNAGISVGRTNLQFTLFTNEKLILEMKMRILNLKLFLN